MENLIVIDAAGHLVGRLATFAAKQALLGKQVRIINSGKAVISGKKNLVYEDFLHRHERTTPRWGPFITRSPDRLLRRIIRGMLPYDRTKGQEAYKRVLCYNGEPEELKAKAVKVPDASSSRLKSLNMVTLQSVSQRLGGKQ